MAQAPVELDAAILNDIKDLLLSDQHRTSREGLLGNS
jgi:hypothetical protein